MKIYYVKIKTIIIFTTITLALTILAAVWSITRIELMEVFSSKREIPIYSVESDEKVASITFDCAWGADDILDILNTLEKENVKATFFIVGLWADKFPDTVKLISEKGHNIANHGHTHLRMGVLSEEKIREEVRNCNKILEELSGKKVDLFRPPYGDYNNAVVQGARQEGCYTIQWDVDSLDWKPNITQEEILSRISKRIQPGSIILFHNDTTYTAKLLPEIIASLKQEGYGFIPVSELIMRDGYYIDHEGRQRKRK